MADEIDGLTLFINLFENGIFSQILEENKDCIRRGLEKKTIATGEHLCNGSKDINTHTFVVASGELELYFDDTDTCKERVIRKIKGPEIIYGIFSIAEMLTGRERHVASMKVKTLEDSVVYCFPNNNLLELARKDSSFAFLLIQNTVRYAQKIRNIIYSISGKGREVWKRKDSDMEKTEEPVFTPPSFSWKGGSYDMRVNAFYSANTLNSASPYLNGGAEDATLQETYPDKNEACGELMKVLELKGQDDKNLLMQHIKVYKFAANAVIRRENPKRNDICFVVDGTVNRISSNGRVLEKKTKSALLGVYAAITGESNRYGITAGRSGCTVAILGQENINQLRKEGFHLLACFCDFKFRQLSPVVRMLDFAITKENIKSGSEIKRKDNSLLYVMMGRLREEVDPQVKPSSVFTKQHRDFGRGSMIGFGDMLYQRKDPQILYAVRDTRVARIPRAVFEYFMEKYPKAFFQKQRQFLLANSCDKTSADISTVACVRLSDDVPVDGFLEEFGEALLKQGKRFKIWHEKDFPITDPTSDNNLRQANLKSVMNSLEDDDRIDIYLANLPSNDEWSELVILQADVILVLGMFPNGYRKDQNHKILRVQQNQYSAEKILLLLHKPNGAGEYEKPTDTWKWLRDKRIYRVDKKNKDTSEDLREHQINHLHLRCPDEMFREPGVSASHKSLNNLTVEDFPRLVRYLLGQSYGLVLGGGGARGFAHVGVIDKMTEAKIPIDMVGGTSMGSFVGAIYCMSTDVNQMEENAERFRSMMTTPLKYVDLTIPYASFTSGCYFNNLLQRILGDMDFEDLWIPYFNITTDITKSKKVVNTKGPLWQYVRASMSLAAIVPPLCDPYNGNYLLDGGSVDNLPARDMKQRSCQTVVAIDVGGISDEEELQYGSSVSSWWLFFQRYNPWNSKTVPDILTVVTKLACISGEEKLKEVQNSEEYIYERPEGINKYGTLQFEEYSNIKALGEVAGEAVVKKWRQRAERTAAD